MAEAWAMAMAMEGQVVTVRWSAFDGSRKGTVLYCTVASCQHVHTLDAYLMILVARDRIGECFCR